MFLKNVQFDNVCELSLELSTVASVNNNFIKRKLEKNKSIYTNVDYLKFYKAVSSDNSFFNLINFSNIKNFDILKVGFLKVKRQIISLLLLDLKLFINGQSNELVDLSLFINNAVFDKSKPQVVYISKNKYYKSENTVRVNASIPLFISNLNDEENFEFDIYNDLECLNKLLGKFSLDNNSLSNIKNNKSKNIFDYLLFNNINLSNSDLAIILCFDILYDEKTCFIEKINNLSFIIKEIH